MLALAELAWSRDNRLQWERFLRKLEHHFARLDVMDVNYCDVIYDVEFEPSYDTAAQVLVLGLSTDIPNAEIKYTLDGTEPSMESKTYDTVFFIDHSCNVKARSMVNGAMKGNTTSREFKLHKGIGKNVHYSSKYSERYRAGGDYGLVNVLRGSIHYNDGHWQGFRGDDVDIVVDLGTSTDIGGITVAFLQSISVWIFLPSEVEFMVADEMNGPFRPVGKFINSVPMNHQEATFKNFSRSYKDMEARYVRITAKNPGPCPDWHPGAGEPSWVFVDEVVIN
jgi:hexosaminidase